MNSNLSPTAPPSAIKASKRKPEEREARCRLCGAIFIARRGASGMWGEICKGRECRGHGLFTPPLQRRAKRRYFPAAKIDVNEHNDFSYSELI